MKARKATVRKIIISLAAAAVMAAVCGLGALYGIDNMAADALYQRPQASDGEIVIIGIDPQSLDDLGRFQDWGRDVLAQALDTLNADPECLPAAIGVDILFLGETDPTLDEWLAEAAGAYDNVVMASYANFGSGVVESGGDAWWEDFLITSYEEPYDALRAVTRQGHINAMFDRDGVLRSSLLRFTLDDGRIINSFNLELARMYAGDIELPKTDGRGFWYMPYTCEPGEYYEGLGISALLDGQIDPGYWDGRIVLIGPYAAGLQDSYTTAVSREQDMFGVEFQANCIEALLRGGFKSYAGDAVQVILLFVVCAACIFLLLDRRVFTATIVWAVLCGGWLLLCLLAYGAGYILHPLWTPLAVTVIYVATVGANYVRAGLEKRRVTNVFKKYVAPEVVNELLKADADTLMAGRLTDIAVLFVDIRGFTPMSEALEPPQVVEILNRYLTLTSTCVMNNQGTLDKFIGDATMAFWGAPLPQEDCVYKAVKTAVQMVEGSEEVGKELMERFGRTVSFGIGVHYGKAVVGNIGAPHRMDYTAIGDTVNTTARLEANAPAGQIYISRAVADALGDRISAVSLGGSIKLKGKAEGFEVLRVEKLY